MEANGWASSVVRIALMPTPSFATREHDPREFTRAARRYSKRQQYVLSGREDKSRCGAGCFAHLDSSAAEEDVTRGSVTR